MVLIFARFNFRETKFSREFIFAISVLKYFAGTYFREFREFQIFVIFHGNKISRFSRNNDFSIFREVIFSRISRARYFLQFSYFELEFWATIFYSMKILKGVGGGSEVMSSNSFLLLIGETTGYTDSKMGSCSS